MSPLHVSNKFGCLYQTAVCPHVCVASAGNGCSFNNNLNWDWLVREAKVNDVTNRLGFAVALAQKVAERKGNLAAAEALRTVEARLFPSVLLREEQFCHEKTTNAERRWLKENCTAEARRWNVPSDLSSASLPERIGTF